MYLSRLEIENFRIFGSNTEGAHLNLDLKPGMNVFVGENDSGKTAVVDAIRIVLQTSSFDYYRLTKDDFHLPPPSSSESPSEKEAEGVNDLEATANSEEEVDRRAREFTIRCTFSALGTAEVGRYLEWLSIDEEKNPVLHITFRAQRRTDTDGGRLRNRFPYTVRSGKDGDGPKIEGDIREFLRVTYLKPLRDAEAELTAGRGSRLSQILENHPDFGSQKVDDFDPDGDDDQVPDTLVGVFRQAEHRIAKNQVVSDTKEALNNQYLSELALGGEDLRGEIGVSRGTELREILEKLELWLEPNSGLSGRTRRGLGYNNILFMATELLLLGDTNAESFPMLLIEEPEAHLHPQMQLRLMSFLEQKSERAGDSDEQAGEPETCSDDSEDASSTHEPSGEDAQDSTSVADESPGEEDRKNTSQIILTTHSPNLASKAKLSSMILMCQGKAFPLDEDHTRLDPADYRFLERFLDVTKSNLFFAKGVLIVEGDAENILLPVLADLLGRPFSKFGVSVVNVGHTGFFRYARILLSKSGMPVPIPVACLADRDVPPDEASVYVHQRKKDGEDVPTFRSQFSDAEIKVKEDRKRKAHADNVKTFVSPTWTLEYDLAERGLAEEVHAAVKAATKERNQNKSGAIIPHKTLNVCLENAANFIAELREAGKTDKEVAASVYRDLHGNGTSKAIAAQMLAQILTDQKPSAMELAKKLPRYLIEAIEHLTGPDLLPSKHAPQTLD